MKALRTTHTLCGLVTVALLSGAFLVTLRNVLDGTSDGALALLIPFLVFCAVLSALTSALTALVLEILALIVLALAVMEDGADRLHMAGALGLCMMVGMALTLSRSD